MAPGNNDREAVGQVRAHQSPSSEGENASREAGVGSSPLEARLVLLLAEPEVRLLMRADNVDEHELLTMLSAVAVRLQAQTSSDPRPALPGASPARPDGRGQYRRGVGIVLINQRNEVFVGRRSDVEKDAWQMPQGGIWKGESPRQAAFRELKEEIGTNTAEILAESKGWLQYDVPAELAHKAWNGRWQGQRQKWFVMLFKGEDQDIRFAGEHPEFNAWKWVSVNELTTLAVSFKHQLYLSIFGEFATLFRD